MTETGHGRPLPAIALAAVVILSLLLLAPAARAASPFGNVVEVKLPRPTTTEVLLGRVVIDMQARTGGPARGSLNVRRAGGSLPAGYSVAAVQARPKGSRVTVRLVAVRGTGAARAGGPLRVKLRIGGSKVVYRRATTATVPIAPDTTVRRAPECRTIVNEAAGWKPVSGLARASVEGTRYAARSAVGAAQQIACSVRIPSVSSIGASSFLEAVDPEFAEEPGATVEGFFATWVKNPDGSARICVFVRGERGGTGDVLVASTTQPFTLSSSDGVAKTSTDVAGEGEYAFRVRWRQSDGTFRTSESAVRVPAGGGRGDDPPAPYSAAGTCA